MTESQKNSGELDAIGLKAAEWLVLRDRGLTAAEQDRFLEWLAADPRHGEWFARQHRTWRDFNLLAEWRPEHSSEPNPDLLARPRRTGRRLAWAGSLAAAAGIALALTVWQPWVRDTPTWSTAIMAPPAGGHRILEDGSVAELNRGAVIAVQFAPDERRVRLVRGEAHFTVAKNPQRPFIVSAGAIKVRAVGTAFDVRLEARGVEVLVTEGRVQVNRHEPAASAPEPVGLSLAAGQRTVVSFSPSDPPPRVIDVSPQEMARRLAWQPQLLDFSSTSLATVVAEFNLRSAGAQGVQLVIADAELGAVPIVASFRSDNVEAFVRLLERTAGVRTERRGENEIVLHKAR